ncbi:MAG TPA: hypothetical protein DDZ99_06160 [Clostridiales bacterium]|nr:hypothetical protein [Clostridiales bacterium]
MRLGATFYVKNSYEAVECYKEAFGLTLGYHLSYDDIEGLKAWGLTVDDDYKPHKGYFHAALMHDSEEVFAVSGECENGWVLTSGHNAQLALNLGSEEAVKKAFSVLSEDAVFVGSVGSADWNACTAEVIDKYGIWWFLCI